MQAFNESKVVGNMAYSSFFFFVFRVMLYIMPDSVIQPSLKNAITGLLITFESFVVMGLYFGPKFRAIYKRKCGILVLSVLLLIMLPSRDLLNSLLCSRQTLTTPKLTALQYILLYLLLVLRRARHAIVKCHLKLLEH